QSWLADSDRLGELEHRDLRDPGQVLKDAKAGDAGERLVMGAELPQRGIGEQSGRGHIKDSLWIIAPPFPLPACAARRTSNPLLRAGEGQGVDSSSASPGTFVGKLAIGLEAAFVDALQAFGDHCLQLP